MAGFAPTMKKLNGRQRKAIPFLLSSSSIEAAAKAAGIGERTIYRWLKDDMFVSQLRAAQDRAVDTAVSRLAGACAEAADVLVSISSDEEEKGSVRVSAARAILGNLSHLIETRDLQERLSNLQQQIEKLQYEIHSNNET